MVLLKMIPPPLVKLSPSITDTYFYYLILAIFKNAFKLSISKLHKTWIISYWDRILWLKLKVHYYK